MKYNKDSRDKRPGLIRAILCDLIAVIALFATGYILIFILWAIAG